MGLGKKKKKPERRQQSLLIQMVVPGATSTTPRVGKLGGARQKSRKFLIQSRLASLGGVSRSLQSFGDHQAEAFDYEN